jgi:UDP-N-acetylglucosamine 2-epimerase (non-hydrolysing)
MLPNQTLAGLTARLMDGVDGRLELAQPDIALEQGDTTTVLVASLGCFYRRIPTGQFEAGLRTGNVWAPFPEEVNRRLASTSHPPRRLGRPSSARPSQRRPSR